MMISDETTYSLQWKGRILWKTAASGRLTCVGEIIRDEHVSPPQWGVFYRGARVHTAMSESMAQLRLESIADLAGRRR